METTVLAWDAPEYHYIERNADWFWSLGIITATIVVLSILFNNILFAVFILLGALAGGIYAAREPATVHYELQHKGVLVGKLFYPYHTLRSFWVDEGHPHPKLILNSKHTFAPHIIIPITGEVHHDDVSHYLLHMLPEVRHEESKAHKLLERLGL
jgi:hypothetical protein